MLKKLFVSKFKTITSAAIVISLAGLASRLLGIVRDRVLAGEFGAGAALDMYYAAFRVPDFVYNIVVFGAISAGFIPIFTALIKKEDIHDKVETSELTGGETHHVTLDNNDAWDLTNNVVNVFSIALIVVSGLLLIFARDFVELISPGFSPKQIEITTNLTRIMFLSPIFLGISGIFGGVLQSFKRFFVYSLAPIMYNIGIIIGAVVFTRWWDIYGLAWGVALGALLHLAVQLPVARELGYKYRFFTNFGDKNLIKIFKMMIPRVLGLATTQVNLIVVTIFGSMLAAGSITIFNFAINLQSLPVGLIGIAFAIAAFPTLSSLYSKKDYRTFNNTLNHTVRMILFGIIPMTIMFLVLRLEIVELILDSGRFSSTDARLTATALGIFSISLFAQSLIPLLARAFFARHNTIVPFLSGLVGAGLNVLLAWILSARFGVVGLAFAFSISAIVNFLLLIILLRTKIGDFDDVRLWNSFLKISGASIVMGVVMFFINGPVGHWLQVSSFFGTLIQLIVVAGIGSLVYFVACTILKCKEINYLKGVMKKTYYQRMKRPKEGLRNVGR